MEASGRKKDAQ